MNVYSREEGIQAIIELQAFGGITESVEAATKGWDSLSEHDKMQTTLGHQSVCKKNPNIIARPKKDK